jgi:DNA-directed RNA polymerase specialized sigma24 family protein
MGVQEYIEYMLQNHRKIRESIDMIKRNMSEAADRDDIIEALSMPGMEYDAIRVCPTNVPSDRLTSIIDSLPRELYEHRKALGELRAKLSLQEYELSILDRGVAALPEPSRNVILLLYYECLSWSDAKARTHYSGGTLSNYRTRGVAELVKWYEKYCTRMNWNEHFEIELN